SSQVPPVSSQVPPGVVEQEEDGQGEKQTPQDKEPEALDNKTMKKPAVPPQGAMALTPNHIDQLTLILYRASLLGATYARPQIRAIRLFFQKVLRCSPSQLRRVRDTLKKLQSQESPLVPPTLEGLVKSATMLRYAERLVLLHTVLFLLGCKSMDTLERYRDFLSELSIQLRIDPNDVSLFSLFGIGGQEVALSVQDCFALLGVDKGAEEKELRKAHRDLVRRYHPDQFHNKGAQFVRLAERKMKEANMALEILLYRRQHQL
ncbi:MAG: DnaJ domain-containing protein, partial [Myxococcota bacterium]